MTAALWLLALACDPGVSASPERQAEARGATNGPILGPAERASVEAWHEVAEARDAELARRADAREREALAERERALSAGAAWDLRLLDVLSAELDVTAQIAGAVAARGETAALREWAGELVRDADGWRAEIARLRARWYGIATSPRVVAPIPAEELAPFTVRVAERWRRGRRPPADEPPLRDLGRPPQLEPVPFAQVRTAALEAPGTVSIPAARAAEALTPLAHSLLTLATTGTMQASRAELRALAVRVQLGQRAALATLATFAAPPREADRPRG